MGAVTAVRDEGDEPAAGADGYADDLRALSAALEEESAAVRRAGPLKSRTAEDVAAVGTARLAGGDARRAFLDRHVEAVYRRATDGLRLRLLLPELVERVAASVPGLVPGSALRMVEAARPLHEQEGYTIDLGIFVAAVLRDGPCGEHLQQTHLRPGAAAVGLLPELEGTGVLDLGPVLVAVRDNVATVTFRNDYCLNAEDDALAAAMEVAVDVVLLHPGVRVGVLRGGAMSHPKYAGRRVFSAGINLRHLRAGQIDFLGFLIGRELGYVSKLVHGLRGAPSASRAGGPADMDKPWIAVVDEFAIGGGMQIVLACDHVLLVDDAYLSLPAASEGIVPGAAPFRLQRLVGDRVARRLVLGGEAVRPGHEAMAGLVDENVAGGDVEPAVDRAAGLLGSGPGSANAAMLAAGREDLAELRRFLATFADVQAHRLYAADIGPRLARFGGGRAAADG